MWKLLWETISKSHTHLKIHSIYRVSQKQAWGSQLKNLIKCSHQPPWDSKEREIAWWSKNFTFTPIEERSIIQWHTTGKKFYSKGLKSDKVTSKNETSKWSFLFIFVLSAACGCLLRVKQCHYPSFFALLLFQGKWYRSVEGWLEGGIELRSSLPCCWLEVVCGCFCSVVLRELLGDSEFLSSILLFLCSIFTYICFERCSTVMLQCHCDKDNS